MATQANIDQLLLKADLLEHLPIAIFVFVLGSCIGSFLNVVIYRLPRQMRLLTPPSCCPSCNHRLRFFRENFPILGWFMIRGKCRYCKEPVSIEYPLIELITGVLFLLCYVLCYWVSIRTPFFGDIFGQWWHVNGIFRTLPLFVALVTMFSGLLAMTVIDFRTFTIPIKIPLVMTVVAFIAVALQNLITMKHTSGQLWPFPLVGWTWCSAAFFGMAGMILSMVLLKAGIFKASFADYESYIKEDEPLAQYPHARREICKELLFVIPIFIGFVVGFVIGYEKGMPPPIVQGVGGSMLGYLIGGGLIWAVRIFGTFAFGKEAMGLGDVHLLAAVGAFVGWKDPFLIFFIAPFSGLLFAAVTAVLAKMGKGRSEIPYGPHLAIATVIVVLCRPAVDWTLTIIMPSVQTQSQQRLQKNSSEVDAIHVDYISEIYLSHIDLTNGEKTGSIPLYHQAVGCGKAKWMFA